MFARTISNSLFGTTSARQSHSSKVHGETKSILSAAVTKRRLARSGLATFMSWQDPSSENFGVKQCASDSVCLPRRALLHERFGLRLFPFFRRRLFRGVKVDEGPLLIADHHIGQAVAVDITR